MTIEEALQELQAIVDTHESPDGFFTMDELCEASGRSKFYLWSKVKRLHKAGRVEVRKVMRPTITGHPFPRPAYRLLGE